MKKIIATLLLAIAAFGAAAHPIMVHIPYTGGAPAQLALLSDQVDLTFDNLASASANIRSGKLRAIAVATSTRASAMPEVPTIAEDGKALGLGRFDINTWFGLFGPAKLSPELTQRFNQAFIEALNSPELKARLTAPMAENAASTSAQFAAFVKGELAKYRQVVKASGATVE